MRDLNDKITGGTLSANEWNEVPSELQNVITSTGQALSAGDLQQLVKGVSNYASGGDFYADSGTANSYVLTPIGSKVGFNAYQDGQKVRFIPANSNTGAATVNVAALGVINIKNVDGSNISAGDIQAGEYIELVYESGTPSFVLVPQLNNARIVELKSGRKNKIINGNFDIWQRGVSFSAAQEYTADRWIKGSSGSTAITSQQSFALGQTDVPNNPEYFARNVVTSSVGASNRANFIQRIESVKTLAGQEVSISFWAKADSNKLMSVDIFQNFGSGGSPSVGVSSNVRKFNLTASWQKFTYTGTAPSVSGKTLGTDGNDALEAVFWFDAGTDFNSRTDSLGHQSGTFDIAQVQVEKGPIATDFENRSIGEELLLCQRYYAKSYNLLVDPGSISINNSPHFLSDSAGDPAGIENFPVRMRSSPSVTIYRPSTGAANQFEDLNESNVRTVGAIEQSETGIFWVSPTVATAPNVVYQFHYTANAEL